MLYDRWQEVAREFRPEIALRDLSSGQVWTFEELQRLAEQNRGEAPRVVFPQGHSVEFILTVLRGWRTGAVVCPLEPHEQPPALTLPRAGVCHLKSTSATTGAPRSILFTGEQLAADADNIVATMGLRPAWPNLGAISLAHSYGFSNLVLPLLLHGIPLLLAPSPLPEILRLATRTYPNLTLPGVPALWRAWHEGNALNGNVRLAISAGAPLGLLLEKAVFKEHGIKVHNFYGSSECGGVAYDGVPEPRTDESCVGRPLRNVRLEVDGQRMLVVRSPAVGETYWPEPNASLASGSFRTSDLAELAGGLVYLRGRAGDQISVAGRKVSPTTIEQALCEHPTVKECLVFGVPSKDTDRVEAIVACVAANDRTSAEELRQFLLRKVPSWQVPRDWWFVNSLQVNGRGKLSRAEWRTKFLERQRDV